jgi:hypothetical protein
LYAFFGGQDNYSPVSSKPVTAPAPDGLELLASRCLSVPFSVRLVARRAAVAGGTVRRGSLRVSIGSQQRFVVPAGESSEGEVVRAGLALSRMHYNRRGYTAGRTEGKEYFFFSELTRGASLGARWPGA